MYQLIKPPVSLRGGDLSNPQFARIKAGLERNYITIQNFYRDNPRYINSGHFLVKLIQTLGVSLDQDDYVYVSKVDDWAMSLAMTLKMTSAIYRGKLFSPGHFYGPGVDEIIIANTDTFDIDEAVKNWPDLQPIRVLSHPFADLDMAIPNGKTHSDERGIAVITINIPLLALQYKCWRRWNSAVSDGSPRSTMQFLYSFPLPNMIESQTNIAILNRAMIRFFEGSYPKNKAAHSFYLTNWSNEVDRSIDYFYQFVQHKALSFSDIISHMPSMGNQGMHGALKLPEEAFTVQIQWAVVMARLALTTFLVQFNEDTGNTNNQGNLNYLRRWLSLVEINRGLEQALPKKEFDETMYIIDEGIKPYL